MKSSQIVLFVVFLIRVSTDLNYLSYLCYLFSLTFFIVHLREVPYGLVVRIPGFHPGGPGSTPGIGIHFLSAQTLQVFLFSSKT